MKNKAREMLTITKITDEYGIQRKYIDSAIKEGYLPGYRFGNKTKYIKRVDLEWWIEQNKLENGQVPLLRSK